MAELSVKVTESGIDTTERKLKKIGKTGDSVEKSFEKSSVAVKDFGRNTSAAIATIDGPLGGVASRVSSVTTLLTSGTAAATGFGVAIAAAGFAVFQGVQALDEYNVGLARTEAILKATGGAAGFTAEQLREQADALALATLTSTTEVQKAQAQLATFNRVTGDVFTDAIVLSQDLAETGFGSITSASVQLGKALQDPIKGVGALAKVGVSFNETQRETIRLLQESGDIVGAQAIIIQSLKEQVGGAGAAVASDSLAGKLDTAGQRWSEFTKALAEETGSLTAAGNATDFLTQQLEALTRTLTGDTLDKQLSEASTNLAAAEVEMNRLTEATKGLDRELIKNTNTYLGLNTGLEKNKQLIDQLEAAEREYEKALSARNGVQSKIDERDAERNAAAELAAKKQAELNEQDLKDRLKRDQEEADKKAAKDLERQQQSEARQQESIDRQVESIRVALLTEEQLRLENALNQAELINNSTLAVEEQTDLLGQVWGAYYDDIALKAKESAEKRAKDEQALADRQTKIERQRRKDGLRALDQTTSDLENALGEQSGIFKAVATTNAIIKTYEAANSAYAALAPIPYVGPALGAAAAGAAIGAGLANVAKINSARAQGGQVNRGDNVLVGERGPEVVSFGASGRVFNQSQLGTGQTGVMINVYNQADGVSVNTIENESGGADIYITREEFQDGLAAAAGDPNSEFNQSLQGTYRLERS